MISFLSLYLSLFFSLSLSFPVYACAAWLLTRYPVIILASQLTTQGNISWIKFPPFLLPFCSFRSTHIHGTRRLHVNTHVRHTHDTRAHTHERTPYILTHTHTFLVSSRFPPSITAIPLPLEGQSGLEVADKLTSYVSAGGVLVLSAGFLSSLPSGLIGVSTIPNSCSTTVSSTRIQDGCPLSLAYFDFNHRCCD